MKVKVVILATAVVATVITLVANLPTPASCLPKSQNAPKGVIEIDGGPTSASLEVERVECSSITGDLIIKLPSNANNIKIVRLPAGAGFDPCRFYIVYGYTDSKETRSFLWNECMYYEKYRVEINGIEVIPDLPLWK